jgi:hypothetical protein
MALKCSVKIRECVSQLVERDYSAYNQSPKKLLTFQELLVLSHKEISIIKGKLKKIITAGGSTLIKANQTIISAYSNTMSKSP